MLGQLWTWICRREWAVTALVVLGVFAALEAFRIFWNLVDP